MWHYHNLTYGGHHSGKRTTTKVLQRGFLWLTLFKDCKSYMQECLKCQKTGNISKRDEIPLMGIIEVESFDCRGIEFMGHFIPYISYAYMLA